MWDMCTCRGIVRSKSVVWSGKGRRIFLAQRYGGVSNQTHIPFEANDIAVTPFGTNPLCLHSKDGE
jgi:hypothetical protein